MKQSKWKEILTSNQMFIVYIIVVLCIAISMKTPAFAEVSTIITLARALLVTLCFAICEMVVIISGGIDVSFPAIACASLYIPICVFKENDIDNVVLAFVFAAAIGLVIGIINAVLISLLQIPPLIATLGVSRACFLRSLAPDRSQDCQVRLQHSIKFICLRIRVKRVITIV